MKIIILEADFIIQGEKSSAISDGVQSQYSPEYHVVCISLQNVVTPWDILE